LKFLVHVTIEFPPDMEPDTRQRLLEAESDRGLELMNAGKLVDIWRVPGRFANVSLYEVVDATELHDLITSLPLWPWIQTDVQPLAQHPLATRRANQPK
jgi:muconolactone D-isomerase